MSGRNVSGVVAASEAAIPGQVERTAVEPCQVMWHK
jgi:hypothetical protein